MASPEAEGSFLAPLDQGVFFFVFFFFWGGGGVSLRLLDAFGIEGFGGFWV